MKVFRFLRKPERGSREESPKEIKHDQDEIMVSDVKEWLNENFSSDISGLKEEARRVFDSSRLSILKMRDILSDLESASFGDEKSYAVINMLKDNYVKKASSAINNIPINLPEKLEFTTLQELNYKMIETLGEIRDVKQKQQFVLTKYFNDKSSSLIDNIKEAEERLKEVHKFMNNKAGMLEVEESVVKRSQEQERILAHLRSLEKMENDVSSKIKHKEMELNELRKELDKSLGDKRWEGLERSQKRLRDIEDNIHRIDSSIIEKLSPISKPLKKAIHDGSIERGEAADFFENPLEFFLKREEETFGRIMKRWEDAVGKTNSGLKKREMNKFTESIQNIDKLELLRKERDLMLEEKAREDASSNGFSEIVQMKEDFKNRIMLSENDLRNLNTEMQEILKDKGIATDHLKTGKSDIEDMIMKNTGKRIVITQAS